MSCFQKIIIAFVFVCTAGSGLQSQILNKNWKDIVEENNLIVPGAPIPTTPRIVWLPNKYDEKRAHLVIYNWHKAPQVTVPATPFLKAGETVRLLHPENFYGKPIWKGKIENNSFILPMDDEFAVFVAMKV